MRGRWTCDNVVRIFSGRKGHGLKFGGRNSVGIIVIFGVVHPDYRGHRRSLALKDSSSRIITQDPALKLIALVPRNVD